MFNTVSFKNPHCPKKFTTGFLIGLLVLFACLFCTDVAAANTATPTNSTNSTTITPPTTPDSTNTTAPNSTTDNSTNNSTNNSTITNNVNSTNSVNNPAPYLQYQEPQQQPATPLFSGTSYIFSLVATFLVVLALAYFTSRLVANKMKWSAGNKDAKIISTLSLGSGRGVYLVEIAGKYLILGITEHNINLLKEVTDAEEIDRIQGAPLNSTEPFDSVFRRHISSLQQISQKFPTIFIPPENEYNHSQPPKNKNTNQPFNNTAEEDNREKR